MPDVIIGGDIWTGNCPPCGGKDKKSAILYYSTVAEFRASKELLEDGQPFVVGGYYKPGDGGGGNFFYSSASSASDDGVETYKQDIVVGSGRGIRQFSAFNSVLVSGSKSQQSFDSTKLVQTFYNCANAGSLYYDYPIWHDSCRVAGRHMDIKGVNGGGPQNFSHGVLSNPVVTVTVKALIGDTTLHLNDVSNIIAGYNFLPQPAGVQSGTFVTNVDPSGIVTLSKPLTAIINIGTSITFNQRFTDGVVSWANFALLYLSAGTRDSETVPFNAKVTIDGIVSNNDIVDFWKGQSSGFDYKVAPAQTILVGNLAGMVRKNITIQNCLINGGWSGICGFALSDSTVQNNRVWFTYYQAFGFGNQYDGFCLEGNWSYFSGSEAFKLGSAFSAPYTGRGLKCSRNYAYMAGLLGEKNRIAGALRPIVTEAFDLYNTSTLGQLVDENTCYFCHNGFGEMKTARGQQKYVSVPPVIINGGSGYTNGDIIYGIGGKYGFPFSAIATVSAGAITGLTLLYYGSYADLLPTNPSSVTGGTGSGCTVNLTFSGTADPINETYSLGIVSNNIIINMTDRPGIQNRLEGATGYEPEQYDYWDLMTYHDNSVTWLYPSILSDLDADPIIITAGSNLFKVKVPPGVAARAAIKNECCVRNIQPGSDGKTIGGIAPRYLYRMGLVEAFDTVANTITIRIADGQVAVSNETSGGTDVNFRMWCADFAPLPANPLSVVAGTPGMGSQVLISDSGDSYTVAPTPMPPPSPTGGTQMVCKPLIVNVDGTLSVDGTGIVTPGDGYSGIVFAPLSGGDGFGGSVTILLTGTTNVVWPNTGPGHGMDDGDLLYMKLLDPTGSGTGLGVNDVNGKFQVTFISQFVVSINTVVNPTGTASGFGGSLGQFSTEAGPIGSASTGYTSWASNRTTWRNNHAINGNIGIRLTATSGNRVNVTGKQSSLYSPSIDGGRLECTTLILLESTVAGAMIVGLSIKPGPDWNYLDTGIKITNNSLLNGVSGLTITGGKISQRTIFRGRAKDGVPSYGAHSGVALSGATNYKIKGVIFSGSNPIQITQSVIGGLNNSGRIEDCDFDSSTDPLGLSSWVRIDDDGAHTVVNNVGVLGTTANGSVNIHSGAATVASDNNIIGSQAFAEWTGSVANTTAVFTGSITGLVMTVSSAPSNTIRIGGRVTGTGITGVSLVTGQLTGTTGGIGTYSISLAQTVSGISITESYGTMTVSGLVGPLNLNDVFTGTGVTLGTKVIEVGVVGTTYYVYPNTVVGSTVMDTVVTRTGFKADKILNLTRALPFIGKVCKLDGAVAANWINYP